MLKRDLDFKKITNIFAFNSDMTTTLDQKSKILSILWVSEKFLLPTVLKDSGMIRK